MERPPRPARHMLGVDSAWGQGNRMRAGLGHGELRRRWWLGLGPRPVRVGRDVHGRWADDCSNHWACRVGPRNMRGFPVRERSDASRKERLDQCIVFESEEVGRRRRLHQQPKPSRCWRPLSAYVACGKWSLMSGKISTRFFFWELLPATTGRTTEVSCDPHAWSLAYHQPWAGPVATVWYGVELGMRAVEEEGTETG
jgi:hypothetical protein